MESAFLIFDAAGIVVGRSRPLSVRGAVLVMSVSVWRIELTPELVVEAISFSWCMVLCCWRLGNCRELRTFLLFRSCVAEIGSKFSRCWRLLAPIGGAFQQKAPRREVRRGVAGRRLRQSS